jgi:uncharacterized protein involved in oxidation of intracellular sulfur
MQKILIIVNDPPYGTERSYNGLRLATTLSRSEGISLRVFLMADSIRCAQRGQTTPEGYYNVERMIKDIATKGVEVGACGGCMEARGMRDEDLVEGVHRSNMAELTTWTIEADKVITF